MLSLETVRDMTPDGVQILDEVLLSIHRTFLQMYIFSEKNQHVCSCVSDHMCGYQTVLRPVFNTIYGISSFIEARRSKATSVEVQSTATEMVPMNSLESESSVTNSSHL